jgi:predicted acyl esterase
VATYDFDAFAADVTTIGRPRVTVPYGGTGDGLQLEARLYDVLGDGRAVLADRGGVRLTAASRAATFDLNGGAWRFAKGHRVRLELAQDDDPYVARSSRASSLTLSGATLELPVRAGDAAAATDRAACRSRRRFLVHPRRPRGERLRSVRVHLDGRRVAVRRGRRPSALIDLRGVERTRVRVRIVTVTTRGRRRVETRTYHPCRQRRRV